MIVTGVIVVVVLAVVGRQRRLAVGVLRLAFDASGVITPSLTHNTYFDSSSP